jgi:hypothetical protein
MSEADSESFILSRMTRPPSPRNEVAEAVRKAFSSSYTGRTAYSGQTGNKSPVPITDIKFDPAKLRSMAAKISQPRSWRPWLWERSAKRPETQNAFSFLAHVFQPGEQVQVFDKMESVSPFATVKVDRPMDCRLPALLGTGGRYGVGIWYLCNPVDGEWHHNPRRGKMSCRSEESITSFRHAVLESDEAAADEWLSFLVQLPIRTVAIYTSGGRSIHCLFRVDAPSKQDWDAAILPLKRPLKVLGADAGAFSAVRLTRLPGCWRPEKSGFQKLLYLNPDPPLVPLIEMPVLRTRAEMLTRWRLLCPRWNPKREAFL